MMTLQQTMKKFDFFGQFITLNMNKQNCYTTSLGGVSSIMIIIFLGIFFYSNIVDFVTKQKANAKLQTLFNIDPDMVILNNTNFMTAFSIDQVNFTSRPLFNITLEQKYYHRQVNGTMTKTSSFLDLQPCTVDQFTTKVKNGNSKAIEQQFQSLGMNNWLCPKDDFNFKLQGAYGSENFYFVKITVKECVNNTKTQIDKWNPICASQEQFEIAFAKDGFFKLQVYQINTVVNPGSPSNYLDIYLDSDLYFNFVPNTFNNMANIYYRQYDINNDNSIIPFKEIEQQKIILRTSEDFRDLSITSTLNNQNYAEIYLRRSQMNAQIDRSYQQIGELLSYLGGFMQITKLIFGLFIAFYNRTSLLIELSNKLYDFKEGQDRLSSNPSFSSRTPRFIQDAFKLKGLLDTKNSEGDVKKRSNTMIRQNVLKKLIKKSEPIRFSVKLFLNQITCGICFNERNSKFLKKAIDKMNEDLDLHSILFKINEINKLKEVLFNQSQIILFNFTPKPIIALNDDQMIPTRMNFEDDEQPIQPNQIKQQLSYYDKNLHNIVYQAYTDMLEEIEDEDVPKCQLEVDLKLIHLLGHDITKIFSEQLQLDQPQNYMDYKIESGKNSLRTLHKIVTKQAIDKVVETERNDGKLIQ
ncbi:unnamed protein product [Paramecium pentaurelia]|uniref:Transmembrane protein n=1 Tax=Paramecium pentaurelia TaxID=43138 RepID=A0A8S1XGW8_9CILI|nr:unnamed protein product [Paramecium pentaurelia]